MTREEAKISGTSDLISRQAAIDAICDQMCRERKHECDGIGCSYNETLMGIPSTPGWIPCTPETMPKEPEPNPVFENKPLELYLVTVRNSDYPFRAFWNGKSFTDGWGTVDAIAWMPLPEPYRPEKE